MAPISSKATGEDRVAPPSDQFARTCNQRKLWGLERSVTGLKGSDERSVHAEHHGKVALYLWSSVLKTRQTREWGLASIFMSEFEKGRSV